MLKRLILLVLALAATMLLNCFSQTYPNAFDLSTGNYTFLAWAAESAAGTYPDNMVFHQNSSVTDPLLTTPMNGNWTKAYNLTSKTRINGLDVNGISFSNTSSAQTGGGGFLGAAVLALNTSGRSNISVAWTGGTVSFTASSDRQYRIRMQYSVGSPDNFIDAYNFDGTPVEYIFDYTQAEGHSQYFLYELPFEAENQTLVYIRWKYYQYYSLEGGARPQLRIDDINVTSESDEGTALKLYLSKIEPSEPIAGIPFKALIRTVDENNSPKNLTRTTGILASVDVQNPVLKGTLSGTIDAGRNYYYYNDLSFERSGKYTLVIDAKNGQKLTSIIKQVTVNKLPAISITSVQSKCYVGITSKPLKVEIRKENGNIEKNYSNYNVTLTKVSGPGSITGSLTKAAEQGEVSFDDLNFTSAGTYQVQVAAEYLQSSSIYTLEVKAKPTVTEIIVPQYVKGSGSIGTRIPSYSLITFNNLHPNTTYRYITGARETTYSGNKATDDGSGNNYHYNEFTDTYTYNTDRFLDDKYCCSQFKTGANETSKTIWVNIVPTTNSSFQENKSIYWIFDLGDDEGDLLSRTQSVNHSKCIDFGTTADKATGIYDKKSMNEYMSVLCFYSKNQTGLMPLTTAIVHPIGGEFSINGIYQGPQYYKDIDGIETAWATFLPNQLVDAEGNPVTMELNAIVKYSQKGQYTRNWSDDDGIWAGSNTVQPRGGKDNPIEFKTPLLIILNPAIDDEYCIYSDLEIFWISRGVEKVDIRVVETDGKYTTIYDDLTVDNTESEIFHSQSWRVPRGLFSSRNVKLEIVSSEHNYLTTNSGGIKLYDSPVITEQTRSTVICRGGKTSLFVNADGSELKYQWQKDGIDIPNAVAPIYDITNADFDNSGAYRCKVSGAGICEAEYTKDMLVYVAANTEITKQPESRGIILGSDATFTVEAHVNGVPTTVANDDVILVNWYHNGVEMVDNNRIFGTKTAVLQVNNIQPGDLSGTYYAKVVGLCNGAVSEPFRIFEAKINITAQPENVNTCENSDVEFIIQANSENNYGTLNYQWMKDEIALQNDGKFSGVNTPKLTIKNTDTNDTGGYACLLTLMPNNIIKRSENASLYVSVPPILVNDYAGAKYIKTGETFSFTVKPKYEDMTEYQWYLGNVAIAGANSKVYSKDNATTDDAGSYYCKVTNLCGEITSRPKILSVSFLTDINEIEQRGGYILNVSVPNPVNNKCIISFTSPVEINATMVLTDALGNFVAELYNGTANAGTNEVAVDINKLNISDGTYYYTLEIGGTKLTNKLVIIK